MSASPLGAPTHDACIRLSGLYDALLLLLLPSALPSHRLLIAKGLIERHGRRMTIAVSCLIVQPQHHGQALHWLVTWLSLEDFAECELIHSIGR